MSELHRVLIMAGGTGGHVFPALAVAKKLREQSVDVHWLGTAKGLEARLVPEANFPLHFISIAGVRGKGWKDLAVAPFRLTYAIFQAARLLRKLRPNVVIGMGGFASGPGGVAARLLGYPLVIHEQNAIPGMTNQWLARIATKVLEGFPQTFVPQTEKIVTTGNPVREEIANIPPPGVRFATHEGKLKILILGGSLGAQAFNEVVPQALAKIPEAQRPEVRHQTGEKHLVTARHAYTSAQVTASLEPFIQDMASAYAWADILVCRAGALTIAELCAAGVGAILVPFPHATDDHQTKNAQFMASQRAALLINQSKFTSTWLAEKLMQFTMSRPEVLQMAKAAYQLRNTTATQKIIEICRGLSH